MTRPQADVRRIRRHWHVLCERIGNRYAGTPREQAAADYVEGEFKALGLAEVRQFRFEFPGWDFSRCGLRIGRGRKMRRVSTAVPMEYSVGTRRGGARGSVVYLQGGSKVDLDRDLRGKVGLLIGSLALGDPATKQRIVESGMTALIAVDSRIPFDWKVPIGAAPQWTLGYDVPTCCVPYMEAVRIVRDLPQSAHYDVKTRAFPAASQVVVGEVAGTEHANQVVMVSGHHDCVRGNVGADDNASGVVATMELARLFSRRRPKRTIRFVSFGVEERLSVGAYLYMRSLPAREAGKIVLACNLDSVASHVGQDVVTVTGSPALERLVRRHWERRRHPVRIDRAVTPYSDHFPFNIAGAPSLWLSRPSMTSSGYWTLHSEHDNLDNVCPNVLARTVDSVYAALSEVATASRLPFPRKISPALAAEVRRLAKSAYHHPWSAKRFDYERFK
ncbi:MAG: M28 family peptidase [Phycisphaerae bacterium]|nr:M28 family peptidase [Phycisphaerae bacterium]